jgi:hypothetical protein
VSLSIYFPPSLMRLIPSLGLPIQWGLIGSEVWKERRVVVHV